MRGLRGAARIAFFALLALLVVFTLGPIDLRPQTGQVMAERFAAYFLLGGLYVLAFPARPRLGAVSIVLMVVVLEVGQALAPGRHGRVLDVVEKGAGGLAGILVVALLLGLVRRQPS